MDIDDRALTWTTVDNYFAGALSPHDDVLTQALTDSDSAGLPAIAVSANQGKFLYLQAMTSRAVRILEIGTLGGYSTIWLARALPDSGRLVSLEADPHHAEVARRNIDRAGLSDRVEVRVGPALDSLPTLVADEPFDLFFIDADKVNNPNYFRWALRLSRTGSIIIIDNVVRDGAVVDADSADPSVLGVRQLTADVAAEPRVSATVLQTVGTKGYDGFMLCVVTSG